MSTVDSTLIDAVENEISSLSAEELKAELLKLRVRAKVQSLKKKEYVPTPEQREKARVQQAEYNAKQRARTKALEAMAKELGLFDQIDAQAAEEAAQKVAR